MHRGRFRQLRLLLALSTLLVGWSVARAGVGPSPITILVLPPEHFGAEASEAALASTLHRALLDDLSRGTSCRVLEGKTAASAEEGLAMARSAGADFVLLGTVQAAGSRVRFTGRMISVRGGVPLAGIKLTGERDQIFELEDAIAAAVEAVLPHPRVRRPVIVSSGPLRLDQSPEPGTEFAFPPEPAGLAEERNRYLFTTPQFSDNFGFWYAATGPGFGYGFFFNP